MERMILLALTPLLILAVLVAAVRIAIPLVLAEHLVKDMLAVLVITVAVQHYNLVVVEAAVLALLEVMLQHLQLVQLELAGQELLLQ